jgi:hypothetical protein
MGALRVEVGENSVFRALPGDHPRLRQTMSLLSVSLMRK